MHQLECSGHGEHSSSIYSGLEFCVLGPFSTLRAMGNNCFPGIHHFLNCLPGYISIGLIFNTLVNFLKETMLSALCDIEIHILKVKSEETLERREIKMIQFVKLELNLKSDFFYSFHLVVIERKYKNETTKLQKKYQFKSHSLLIIFFISKLFTKFLCQYLGIDRSDLLT